MRHYLANRKGEKGGEYCQLRQEKSGFKSKDPDEFKRRRIAAIKAAMNQMVSRMKLIIRKWLDAYG